MRGDHHLKKLLVAAAIVAWAILAACSSKEDDGRMAVREARRVPLIHPGVSLPPSTSNVWLVEKGFQDRFQLLRFDASLPEARAFARQLLAGRDAVRGLDPRLQHFGASYGWWLRDFPTNAEGGAKLDADPNAKVVIVPVDGQATVWALLFTD